MGDPFIASFVDAEGSTCLQDRTGRRGVRWPNARYGGCCPGVEVHYRLATTVGQPVTGCRDRDMKPDGADWLAWRATGPGRLAVGQQ
jgi:hypothetical protein